jgi:hypothetical protein
MNIGAANIKVVIDKCQQWGNGEIAKIVSGCEFWY